MTVTLKWSLCDFIFYQKVPQAMFLRQPFCRMLAKPTWSASVNSWRARLALSCSRDVQCSVAVWNSSITMQPLLCSIQKPYFRNTGLNSGRPGWKSSSVTPRWNAVKSSTGSEWTALNFLSSAHLGGGWGEDGSRVVFKFQISVRFGPLFFFFEAGSILLHQLPKLLGL